MLGMATVEKNCVYFLVSWLEKRDELFVEVFFLSLSHTLELAHQTFISHKIYYTLLEFLFLFSVLHCCKNIIDRYSFLTLCSLSIGQFFAVFFIFIFLHSIYSPAANANSNLNIDWDH